MRQQGCLFARTRVFARRNSGVYICFSALVEIVDCLYARYAPNSKAFFGYERVPKGKPKLWRKASREEVSCNVLFSHSLYATIVFSTKKKNKNSEGKVLKTLLESTE